MTFLRVVPTVVLLLCSCVAFAQQEPQPNLPDNAQLSLSFERPKLSFLQAGAGDVSEPNGATSVAAPNKSHLDVSPDGELAMYATCYSMRSYVVARDSKQSDSTHFVRYSTCQPANRYRLKSAEMERNSDLRVTPK